MSPGRRSRADRRRAGPRAASPRGAPPMLCGVGSPGRRICSPARAVRGSPWPPRGWRINRHNGLHEGDFKCSAADAVAETRAAATHRGPRERRTAGGRPPALVCARATCARRQGGAARRCPEGRRETSVARDGDGSPPCDAHTQQRFSGLNDRGRGVRRLSCGIAAPPRTLKRRWGSGALAAPRRGGS